VVKQVRHVPARAHVQMLGNPCRRHRRLRSQEATEDTITFTIPKNPTEIGEPALSTGLYFCDTASIGVQFHGPTVDGGRGGIARHNRVRHMWLGMNHDTWSSNDVLYQNNYYADVGTALNQALTGGVDFDVREGSGLSHDGSVARFTALLPHGLSEGDSVRIQEATVPVGWAPYNRDAVVKEVIDEYTFTYEADLPFSNPNASGAPEFLKLTGEPEGEPQGATYLKQVDGIATFTALHVIHLSVETALSIWERAGHPCFSGNVAGTQRGVRIQHH
jgi:hypothetical protein